MVSERFPPDDPREWLNRARSNLIQAKTLQASVYLEDLCFNAQQGAEKAIKAVLIHQGVEFPNIHDLTELLRLVQGAGERIPDSVKRAGMLSRFAIFTRYPGTRPVSHEEYEEAIKIAEEVLRWAESILRNKNC